CLHQPHDRDLHTLSLHDALPICGFTTICSMPNTNPVPDNVETLDNILHTIESSAVVRVLPYAAITKNLEGTTLSDIKALAEKSRSEEHTSELQSRFDLVCRHLLA